MRYLYLGWLFYLPIVVRYSGFLAGMATTHYLAGCEACSLGGHGYSDYFQLFHLVLFVLFVLPPLAWLVAEVELDSQRSKK